MKRILTTALTALLLTGTLSACNHGSHAEHNAHKDHNNHNDHNTSDAHHKGDPHDKQKGTEPHSGPSSHTGDAHAHHHHNHDKPLAVGDLKPLMQNMLLHTTQLRAALDHKRLDEVATHADHLAKICGEGGPVEADPAIFGAQFGTWDHKLHTRAAQLASQTQKSDIKTLQTTFHSITEACVGCHAQTKIAPDIDLSALAAPFQ